MENRKKGSKRFIAILLIVALLLTGGTVFAYWASSVLGGGDTATGTINVGSGDEVKTEVTVNPVTSAGPLVPIGHSGTNEVYLTFSVLWESDNDDGADDLTGVLAVNIDSVKIGERNVSNLFTVTVVSGTGAITEDWAQSVVIYVQFTNEPADKAEYDLVADKDLVITITFTVNPNA